jgi:uncharacterized repeat protein (TIGR03803 family)
MSISIFFPSRSIFVLILLCAAISIAAPAQTFSKLADLSSTTGEHPASQLTQGVDGNLYGSAEAGGAYFAGTFTKVTRSGTVTDLHDFCLNDVNDCPDGATPMGQIALGADGNFYGSTQGSPNLQADLGSGTLYKITPGGSFTTLYNFDSCTSNCSAYPNSGLTLARNGDFYGTSYPTSASPSAFDDLVFKISSSGRFTNILVVCPNQICPTDAGPYGTLLQAGYYIDAYRAEIGGNLIGPGPGGANGVGAFYKMSRAGTPTVSYSYCADSICHDGYQTNTPIVEAEAGGFFGTNLYGGSGTSCTLTQGCGTAFKIIATGTGSLTKLHDFCSFASCGDGSTPNALILATDGNFYGTTSAGGANGDGTVFSTTREGRFTLIHTFSGTDGSQPVTALYQATDGNLYGTTAKGGANNDGTIFKISLGVAPFVATVQDAGAVGDPVVILGNNLTGATSVTFNGTAATFTVVSDTEITTTVPAGATTGGIQVVTASSSTLLSNAVFVVLP